MGFTGVLRGFQMRFNAFKSVSGGSRRVLAGFTGFQVRFTRISRGIFETFEAFQGLSGHF